MAASFEVELSMAEAPSDAQGRAVSALEEAARTVGLRLTKRAAGRLEYRPRVQFPFLIMLYHTLSGERMTVSFEPGSSGGTRVLIRGAVARSRQAVAADPDHWSEALGASVAPARPGDDGP
ncbi:MAG TPA: hypothetical protein VE983_10470 [Solirubrobacteraceae bacterium]|nr:hypothetical protein [Solirubrobacteraceae bacterium]